MEKEIRGKLIEWNHTNPNLSHIVQNYDILTRRIVKSKYGTLTQVSPELPTHTIFLYLVNTAMHPALPQKNTQ